MNKAVSDESCKALFSLERYESISSLSCTFFPNTGVVYHNEEGQLSKWNSERMQLLFPSQDMKRIPEESHVVCNTFYVKEILFKSCQMFILESTSLPQFRLFQKLFVFFNDLIMLAIIPNFIKHLNTPFRFIFFIF